MTAKSLKKTKNLVVRMAENQLEIERALSLRYDVFNEELGEGLAASAATKKDRDEYDLFCKHLIVVDTDADQVVGTYRILLGNAALKNIGFYSENEFDLSNIRKIAHEVAEIGRSCVHPSYRDGSVISLLWQGLADFMVENKLRYLMGCGSVHETTPETASLAYAFFKKKNALMPEDVSIRPQPTHRLPGFRTNIEIDDEKAVSKKLPPLLKGYLRVGCKFGGEPALDQEFGTVDFFIIFDINEVTERYGKKYIEQ